MIIATDKRDDNLEVDEIISRHVRVASLYSFGIKRHAKQWTSPNSYIFIYFLSVEFFLLFSDHYSISYHLINLMLIF